MNHKAYIHPEGWKFALVFFAISIALTYIFLPLALLGYLLTFFTLWFFRNPERNTEKDVNSIISSADGKVCLIDEASPPPELEMGQEKMLRVCVFMNVFNVHVNRTPISGEIQKIVYKAGSFLNASLDKASEKNERSSMVIANDNNIKIIVVQIAGLIARRILGFVSEKQFLEQGERYGLIRFGSRVDIYMPLDATVTCAVGDKVVAGKSKLAKLNNTHE